MSVSILIRYVVTEELQLEIKFEEKDLPKSELKELSRADIIKSEIPKIYADIDNIFADVRSRMSDIVDNINAATEYNDCGDEDFIRSFFDVDEQVQEIAVLVEELESEFDVNSLLLCLEHYIQDYFSSNGYPDLFDEVIENVDELLLVDRVFGIDVESLLPVNSDFEVSLNDCFDDIPDLKKEAFLTKVTYKLPSQFCGFAPVMDDFVRLYEAKLKSYMNGSLNRNPNQFAQIFAGQKSVNVINVEGYDGVVIKLRFTTEFKISGKGQNRMFIQSLVVDDVVEFIPFKHTKKNQNQNTSPSSEKIRSWLEKASKFSF